MNTENDLFGELHEQEENGLFGNEHIRQYETRTESAIVGNTMLADVAKCQSCGKNNGTDELHSCPYNADINNDDTLCCNCCDDCCHECAMDI